MCNVALGYYLVAPLGRFGELRIVIKRINRTHLMTKQIVIALALVAVGLSASAQDPKRDYE